MKWNLKMDDKRYPGTGTHGKWPKLITVDGTLEQARFVAEQLCWYEAGCEHFWYVEGDPERD